MIKRKMVNSNSQKKGGKRNLVKKATSGLLMTSLASGVIMNANVLEAHANTTVVQSQEAKKKAVINETQDVYLAGANIHTGLVNHYTHNPSLKYSQYKKVITVDLKKDKAIEKTVVDIANTLNYHGSKEYYTSVVETNEQDKTLKLMLAFNPDTKTDKDGDGYADRLNLPSYSEDQMKALANRYNSTLGKIGYNMTNYVNGHKRVDNLRFRRNFNNGLKQSEYDHIMGVIDKHIAANPQDADKNFSLRIWQDPGTVQICVTVHVDQNSGAKEGEQAVDSEQAKLLEMIKVLRGNYEERKAKEAEAFVAPEEPSQEEPAVEEPVVEETEVVEEATVVEETKETEEVVDDVVEETQEETVETTTDGDFTRISNGGAVVIDIGGDTKEQQDMNAFGTAVNQKLFDLINEARRANGLTDLSEDTVAKSYADYKSLDMMGGGPQDTVDSSGMTPYDYMAEDNVAVPTSKSQIVGECVIVPGDADLTAQHLYQLIDNSQNLKEKVLSRDFTKGTVSVAFKDQAIFFTVLLTDY